MEVSIRTTRATILSFVLILCTGGFAQAFTHPDKARTPGVVCTDDDSDFTGFAYDAHVAKCARNIAEDEKQQVADWYGGIERSDWSYYEFDHLIPLCAGGSNSPHNLWPQPIDEAKEKDKVEDEVCRGLREGTLDQSEAIAKVWAWFDSEGRTTAIPQKNSAAPKLDFITAD